MRVIDKPVPFEELWKSGTGDYNDMIKAVVDIEKGLMAVDAEMHSDLEALLLESGSRQPSLWGINIYPPEEAGRNPFLEFTSFINIRPAQNNKSMEVLDRSVKQKIEETVHALLI
jgi:hypothetical protein